MIILSDLPLPPSENNCYPTNRFGKRFPSKQLKEFKKIMNLWALQKRIALLQAKHYVKAHKRLTIHLTLYFRADRLWTKKSAAKRLDVQNYMKCAIDSISKHLEIDDCHFWHTSATKIASSREYMDVMIQNFDSPEFIPLQREP